MEQNLADLPEEAGRYAQRVDPSTGKKKSSRLWGMVRAAYAATRFNSTDPDGPSSRPSPY